MAFSITKGLVLTTGRTVDAVPGAACARRSPQRALVRLAVSAGAVTTLPTIELHPGLYLIHRPGSGLTPVRFVKE
ncbi:MAG: hypothetical protein IPM49_05310 [Flavobacteriales bacterium]|nr:hypothetical protein [Flavobacteriales bacterium]